MMAAHLHDLDVEQLFMSRTVEQIEQVHKSINAEIERKKEDLRTLVGERYRDLIEAADKIKEMKELSNLIIRDVDDINSSLVDLQRKSQGGVRGVEGTTVGDDRVVDSVAAQVSLMVELPELIWSAVGGKDYLRAAQLFLLARHVKTNFDVDRECRRAAASTMSVLERLWSSIGHFPRTIVASAEADLRCVDASRRTAAACLAAVHLLRNVSILDRFLELRAEAVGQVLDDDNVARGICGSSACVVNTLSLLKTCFVDKVDSSNGLVWQLLNSVSRNSSPVILLERHININFLPAVVTNFKLNASDSSVLTAQTEAAAANWLNSIKTLVALEGSKLLTKVTSLQDLNSLKTSYSVSEVEWESLLDAFNAPNRFKLWDGLYKPIIAERTKELITSWTEATYTDLTRHILDALNSDDQRSDLDLRWFVWKESEDDLDARNSVKPVFLKSKAIVPKVAQICASFDSKLTGFYKDLAGFYATEDIMSEETVNLKAHQQKMTLDVVLKLKGFVRDLVGSDVNDAKLSVIARLLQAIPDLCPMLQKCLALGDTKGNTWHEVKLLLGSEALFCWQLWEERTLARVRRQYISAMMTTTSTESYADLLNVTPQWDIVWIEEAADRKSQLKVPSAPSLSLQSTLHAIVTDLSRVHLPRLIHESATQKILPLLFDCYDRRTFTCPSESFQALFDLKYLSALYVPLTNKDLNAFCQDRIAKLESTVDPIDLEVFAPLIRAKVKESLHRTQGMFATSYSAEENTSLQIGDDPCILALSKSASSVWFPSLPIANPSNRPLHIIKPKAVKLGKQINEMESSKSSSLSAASFFSDWFS